MMNTFLSLLLSLQIFLSFTARPSVPGEASAPVLSIPQESRLWWGLIDPELSAWFAHLPADTAKEKDDRILWDWSWRGFWAALFGNPSLKEAQTDAAHL